MTIVSILHPGGKLILTYEYFEQWRQRNSGQGIFQIYSMNEVEDLLIEAALSNSIEFVSRKKGNLLFHCVVSKI